MGNYYRRYTGSRRRKKRHILLGMLILLVILLLTAGGLYLYANRAELPEWLHFSSKQDPPEVSDPQDEQAGTTPDDDFELIIEDPADPQPQPDEEPEPLPRVCGWYAAGTALLEDSSGVLTDLRDSGRQQLAVLVKDGEGYSLLPDSTEEQGAVSDQAEAFARILSDAKSSTDTPPVAILPALRDNLRPRKLYRSSALHVDSGATWLDRNYEAWFSPAGKDTAACLLAQLEACQAQGFSHVILTDFQFPTLGKTELIDDSDMTSHAAALTQLARTLSEGTELSLGLLLTDSAAQNLLDSDAGQDVMELAQYFDVLYVDTAAGDTDLTVLRQALAETDCRLGVFVDRDGILSDDSLDVIYMER